MKMNNFIPDDISNNVFRESIYIYIYIYNDNQLNNSLVNKDSDQMRFIFQHNPPCGPYSYSN